MQNDNFEQFLNNLKKDGIYIETRSHGGDSKIIITTRNWKTILGANDLGIWGESQEQINKE